MKDLTALTDESIALLQKMVAIPSISRDEKSVADMLQEELTGCGLSVNRHNNNIWLKQSSWEDGKPVILLNAHIDTVKPAAGYTRDPFVPTIEGDTLYGLGTNDDGASVVSLLAVFRYFDEMPQAPFNLIFAATAEEEVSGRDGIESILPLIGPVDFGIVGEPTGMQMAVAEKGLMVLDCTAHGISGHAARNEGVNAIYKALTDIEWFRTHQWDRVSPFLGPVKMSVTQINAGTQHNVVPDTCSFVVDVRVNELYDNKELLGLIKEHVSCDVKERSTRLNSSRIDVGHPIVRRGEALGMKLFGSPTLSDQALMPFPTVKVGPGDSARSHSADEYIRLSEIREAVDIYVKLLRGF
ncbi:MAG: M20 family metallo-hydrolase [Marinilabiliaceae bacterium]|nr:M20 family metallo-hydrolase [Marinilabiliaceae bacterium]